MVTSPWDIRLGLRLIRGLSEADAQCIVRARREETFGSLRDFSERTKLSRSVIMRLSQADAFASLGRNRRQNLWEALAQDRSQSQPETPLFDQLTPEDDAPVELPTQESIEQVFADYDATGLSLKAHPISFYREQLSHLRVATAAQLPQRRNDQRVTVAGLVLLRQRPSTAKGITFVTLEDETGTINLVLHQQTWQRYYTVARRSPAWLASGRLEIRQSIIHLVVFRIDDLAQKLRSLHHRSRDFR